MKALRSIRVNYSELSDRSGFTLLELMISFTIIGLVLVLVFGALRIGARAWEKGERDVEIHQRERVVLDNMRRQITSVCPRKLVPENEDVKGQQKIFFEGDEQGMTFISRHPMSPLLEFGMVYAKYVVRDNETGRKKRLLLYENDAVFIRKVEDIIVPDEVDFIELISGAEYIGFSYLSRPESADEDPEWQEAWDPDSDMGIPLAVKITLQYQEEASPVNVIASIRSEAAQK